MGLWNDHGSAWGWRGLEARSIHPSMIFILESMTTEYLVEVCTQSVIPLLSLAKRLVRDPL